MTNHGFNLPMPKARGSRQAKIEREEGIDVGDAVSYLEEAERGSIALVQATRKFAIAAEALLNSGLTDAAVVALIQALMPNVKNGRPFPGGTILAVLKAAGRLKEHLKEK